MKSLIDNNNNYNKKEQPLVLNCVLLTQLSPFDQTVSDTQSNTTSYMKDYQFPYRCEPHWYNSCTFEMYI